MYYGSCNWPEDHKREGREDFERRGRYGYDMEKYHDHFNDCNRAYSDGFDEARRNEDRRQEEREQEEREERRIHERRMSQRQAAEDAYHDEVDSYYQQQEQEHHAKSPDTTDDLPF